MPDTDLTCVQCQQEADAFCYICEPTVCQDCCEKNGDHPGPGQE